jgi:predicted homoserine dehydrogenase-like protein
MLFEKLQEREHKRPIAVGVIGAGTFGTQIITQICRMQGMRVSAVADPEKGRAVRALKLGGLTDGDIYLDSGSPARDMVPAVERRTARVVADAGALFHSDSPLDVIVEATGIAEVGARHGYEAVTHGKNLVMATVEADVLVGYLLKKLADEKGSLYSMAYGDEPALALELYDWARSLGFRVIAAGKGTRFKPAFRLANPDDVPRMYGFSGKDYNAKMFCSFLDGTKHSIEMTALANATGLVPDVRGMHFPKLDLREIPDKLCSLDKGGLLHTEGVVEAVSSIGPEETPVERSIRGGVYAVIDAPSAFPIESLGSYGEIIGMIIGKRSKHALIYRPQHFVGHEVAIGIARMMLYGQTCGVPVQRVADVIACAKKRLAPGTVLDGEGGYTVYGLIERANVARAQNLVPLGLTQGAEVLREIPEHGAVTYDQVRLRPSQALELRKRQDALP